MPPLLPPIIAADTLLSRRAGAPPWDDQATTTLPYGQALTAVQVADRIIDEVGREGDAAVTRICAALGAGPPETIGAERLARVADGCPPEVLAALQLAGARIRAFCEREPVSSWSYEDDGVVLGQLARPVGRVGVYVPGGCAPLVSSLLMAAIPARVAGVGTVHLATPPVPDGGIAPVMAAAALTAGVEQVVTLGGPTAVAAMALGTATVPRVDLLCGPGAGPTVAAMARVAGRVGVVSLPGPTETLLVADETADPATVAADLLAQAEHDPTAWPVLVATSRRLAQRVQREVAARLDGLARAATARQALGRRGAAVVVADVDEALEVANRFAPEHLCLLVADPWSRVDQVTDAGGIFVGEYACEALGDYVAGPSHIMPTGGSARWASPLSVRDFVRMTTVIGASPEAVGRLVPAAITLAEAEGLTAHAAALRRRR